MRCDKIRLEMTRFEFVYSFIETAIESMTATMTAVRAITDMTDMRNIVLCHASLLEEREATR